MLGAVSRQLLGVSRQAGVLCSRNFGASAVAAQKAQTAMDPIQQAFVGKIREYADKSKKVGGGLVDATDEVQVRFSDELKKLEGQFQTGGQDMTQFPAFSFSADPALEAVSVKGDVSEAAEQTGRADDVLEGMQEQQPYWRQIPGWKTPLS